MSDNSKDFTAAFARAWLQPRWFFAGLALGFMVLGWLGRRAARTDYHLEFIRFHPPISPEGNYYPTLDEMCAIVRTRCRPEQVLVIVGGNSILHGVWQPTPELWSKRLQERLGDGFCVINFAFRGASPTDAGAVVAEALRDEFPRQIYLANERAMSGAYPLGGETYRFVFWEAYFGGRLLSFPVRNRAVRAELLNLFYPEKTPGIVGGALLQRALHYRDFWNRAGFERFFTVPSLYAPTMPGLLTPRRSFPDTEVDVFDEPFLSRRYAPAVKDAEMAIMRAISASRYRRRADGTWELLADDRAALAQSMSDAFPEPLKRRTLMLLSQNSPYYRRLFTADEQARDDLSIRDSLELWHRAGYPAIEYGRDWTDDDFADRTHLSKLGARKLAEAVEPEVRSLAAKLGYLQ